MKRINIKDLLSAPPPGTDKKAIKDETDELVERFGDLQKLMMAEAKHSLLVIFQGMDASGKDGAVRKIFRDCHPNGLSVYSFKKPTDEEFARDFLWRVHKRVPAKGMIQIFNRSHYEDVLIQRVHGWIDEQRVDMRFDAINAFERLLELDNNTKVLKFFLNISYDQQAIELQERIDEADKHWKHNPNDWKEREHWDKYMVAYEDVLNRSAIPWTVVPVDERWYRDYVVAKKIVETLESLDMAYPPLNEE
ncbi:MAG: PPK2 family polyphosphate kinase [Bacteroidota bacterium]